MQPIPKETIIRASEGDMEAFEEIYRLSAGYVYTLGYRIMGNREDAEEVTQDVFVRIYRRLGSFRFRSSFKTWLYRITVNTAINLHRKRSRERGKKIAFDENIEQGKRKERTFDREHNETLIKSMLESIPADQRACLVLKEIEGLKYKEIAATLGIKINTVRSRLRRAREKLLSIYGKKGEQP